MVKLRLLGVAAMLVMGYTGYRAGLATQFDVVMLSTLIVSTLGGAILISLRPHYMRHAATVNAVLFTIYMAATLFMAAQRTHAGSTYTFGAVAQFIPSLYVALFVLAPKRATMISWAIYGLTTALCGYGLLLAQGTQALATEQQMYWAILASHPCCILALSFMTHLRYLVTQAQHDGIAAKERFLAVVSHEVRSPLQTIVSSLEVFESAPTGPLADRAMKRIRHASAVLDTQIRDLTTFTKLELSPQLNLDEVDLHALLDEVVQLHQDQAQRLGLVLSLHLETVGGAHPPLVVKADGVRLRQILDNLVSNALKYTPRGEVSVGLSPEPTGLIHLWVKDTGRGIPADRQTQVFEPFVRIKAHAQERIEGSGLGLSVVKQLVGLMQGRLQLDSVEGLGTTVHVRLPLAVIATRPAQAPVKPPQRVLVIDDDINILHAISDLLKTWGVEEVVTATDGETGLTLLGSQAFDLALVDLQMPGTSGYEVALSQQRGPTSRTPLIAMSANAIDQRTPGAEAFCAFLPKPVNRSALVQAIVKALA